MNDRISFGTDLLEIKQSLDVAVEQAGGCPQMVCSLDNLHNKSVFELLCTLASNKIRFVYIPPKIN